MIIIKFRQWLRKEYLFFRYKYNKKHNLIQIKPTDRAFGLSTLIMKDSLYNNIPILVSTEIEKKAFAHKMFMMGQLGFAVPRTEYYIMNNLLITPKVSIRGKRVSSIYVDGACCIEDVDRVCEWLSCGIENGFVREDD